MRTGEVEANLLHLNAVFKLPYLPELISRKLTGAEKSNLEDADMLFHEKEYVRLRAALEEAGRDSKLPELPTGKEALNDLLIRVRLHSVSNRA
jgi:predicted nucleotidyltransferase